jgi:hypothetical protein
MTRPLKVVGVREVATLRRRVRRLLALARIFPEDAEYIVRRLDEVEARIVRMTELNEYGREE